MKVKHIIILIVLGAIMVLTGAFFKIQHWPGAAKFLLTGFVFEIVGLALIIWKILTTDKFRDFLNL